MFATKPTFLDFSKKMTPKWKRKGRKSELRILLETPDIRFRYVDSINLSNNYLCWNDFEDELPMLFQKCSRLKHLDLSHNDLGGKTFIEFLNNSLNKFPQLTIIISGNPNDKYLEEFLKSISNCENKKIRIINEKYEFYDIDKLFCDDEDEIKI